MAGLSHLELNHADEALSAFQETTVLAPDHVDAHYQLGGLYAARGELNSAIAEYETTIRLDDTHAEAYLNLGRIYLSREEKDNVIRVYEKGLELSPNHPQEQYDLALIFEERNELQKALTHYKLANEFSPDNLEWHFRYARLLDRYADMQDEKMTSGTEYETVEERDKYAAMAVQEYNRAIQLNLNYAPAYYYRGLISRRYKQIGGILYRFAQIAEDFKQVVTLEPNNADALYHLGLTYLDMDKRLEAKSVLEKILKLNPKYKGVNLQLGLIAEWREELDTAIGYYEQEITLDDNAAEAHQQLAALYLRHKWDFDKAEREFKKALAQDPNHVPTLTQYGNLLYNQEKYNAAAEQFEIAIHIKPEDPTANYYLALMYQHADKTKLAIAQWKKFLKLHPPEQWAEKAREHLQKLE